MAYASVEVSECQLDRGRLDAPQLHVLCDEFAAGRRRSVQNNPPNCNIAVCMIFRHDKKAYSGPLTGHFRHALLFVFLDQHR